MLWLLAAIADVVVFLATVADSARWRRFVLACGAGFGAAALVHALIPNKDVGMVVGAHIALAGLVVGLIWQSRQPEPKP